MAAALAWAERLMVTARGPEFATAREIALKLTEAVPARRGRMTATDLAHGPIAAIDERFPVWISAARDGSLAAVREAVERFADSGAPLVAAGPGAAGLGAGHAIELPPAPDPLLAPLLSCSRASSSPPPSPGPRASTPAPRVTCARSRSRADVSSPEPCPPSSTGRAPDL